MRDEIIIDFTEQIKQLKASVDKACECGENCEESCECNCHNKEEAEIGIKKG